MAERSAEQRHHITEYSQSLIKLLFNVFKGRPDPPYDIRMVSCGTKRAEIEWVAGVDNNDPITEYHVYYNTSFDKTDSFTKVMTTTGQKLKTSVCFIMLDY
jgi:hypothetical protein